MKKLILFTFSAILFLSCSKDKKTVPTQVPTLITMALTNISTTTAISGGEISNDGGSTVTERGICYGTATDPTTKDTKIINATTGTGSFIANMTNLTINTLYYVRAYAVNSMGTAYGNEFSFTTLPLALSIGQAYQGGKIAFIDGTGQHGLIAASSDQAQGTTWDSAKDLCDNYSVHLQNGTMYNDWYLPDEVELNHLYINRIAIGGFNGNEYWSSTLGGSDTAAMQVFSNVNNSSGFQTHTIKTAPSLYGRAVRKF
jgi:hypothetical protein